MQGCLRGTGAPGGRAGERRGTGGKGALVGGGGSRGRRGWGEGRGENERRKDKIGKRRLGGEKEKPGPRWGSGDGKRVGGGRREKGRGRRSGLDERWVAGAAEALHFFSFPHFSRNDRKQTLSFVQSLPFSSLTLQLFPVGFSQTPHRLHPL